MLLYKERLKKLQHLLKEASCEGLVVEDPTDLYYLTGLNLSSATLLVHTKGAHLTIDGRYYEMCKKSSPFPVHLQKKNEPLMTLLAKPELKFVKNIAFNTDSTSYERYRQLKKEIQKRSLKPIANPIAKLRCIKDLTETDTLRKAARLGSEGFDFVCTLLKEGISEAEIAVELEIFWKRKGGKGLAFDPIIAFGPNSSMPHYNVGNEHLQKNTSVLIDIGVNFQHYHSDMTRVVFFGKPDPEILVIYDIVQRAQQKALALCRPSTQIGDLDAAARDFISEQGYGENFTHGLGHGIGLDVHESPTLRNQPPYKEIPLEPGMVITIEPGIYLPGIGGVRIEDTIVITPDGYENLTNRPTEPLFIDS
ncbi:MAG: M24 family metallopeptidase [Waddliaceae bacterium]